MFRTKAQRIVELLEGVQAPPPGSIPRSAIRSLRGDRPQATVAMKAGMSQAALSRLEKGERSLSPEAARKLGPALGVEPVELLAADQVANLHQASLKGTLDPRTLLAAVEELSWTLPDDEVGEDLIDALLGILKRAIETYDSGQVTVATKAREGRPPTTRDSFGRRIDKPNQPGGGSG